MRNRRTMPSWIRPPLVAGLAAGWLAGAVSADSPPTPPSLRQLAAQKRVAVGAMILDPTWRTAEQQALVSREFGVATVGTFWTRVRPQSDPGSYDWSVTDDAVAWADSQGMGVHLHPLLYPADPFNPAWVLDELDANPQNALTLLEEHFANAMARYRGVVDVWDVVNEAVDPSGGYRPSKWRTAIESLPGVDNYVVEAFRIARRLDPDATLLYNDHDIELSSSYQTNKWTRTQEILTLLAAEGLVDGLGWQLHTNPGEVLGDQFALAERMAWVRDTLGLKNFVTELDMELDPALDPETDAEGLAAALDAQGEAYQRVTEVWLDHSGGGWLQTWGVYDRHTNLGSAKRPLLFDEDYNPKPAYDGVVAALLAAPDPTPGDYNGDSIVDTRDHELWRQTFGDTPLAPGFDADGSVDGIVSVADYAVWRDLVAAPPTPAGVFAVPSPTGCALASAGLLLLLPPHRAGRRRTTTLRKPARRSC